MVAPQPILGESASMAALRDQIRHLASFDAPRNPHVPTVLLLGETGTGKGLVARVMHESGPRHAAPLIDVNCAAIPENMLEAELFGFEAGAFTDARRAKAGLFEAASGGTLFLDEVDALSITLQSKLLKAIEEKSVRRLGALEPRQVDVKLVAATQRDLKAMVAEGDFRPDLYHRLAVVVIEIPPLRDRDGDAVRLAEHFLEVFSDSHALEPRRLTPSAEEWLAAHPWSGNVRELSHLIERVTLMGPRGELEAETLERLATPLDGSPPSATAPVGEPVGPPAATVSPTPTSDEPDAIRDALARSGGNVVAAARLLGLGRNALRYRMRRYGIERPNLSDADVGRAPKAFDAEPAPSRVEPAPLPTWEQKAVAVLAIDLAFPDHVAGEAGQEPWTATTHWQQEVEAKVRGFGGVLVQKSASRMVAVFGIPKALEQGAQRAVHAASAVQRLEGAAAPERRIAVHAGAVRVDTATSDPAAHVLPIGDVLSLPERLLGHAGAGEVVLSPVVARRLRGIVNMTARELRLGPAEADRVQVTTVGSAPASDLPEQLDQVQARFVGRSGEITFLQEAFASAEGSQGQLAFVVGDAGIGKSRLIAELRESIADRDHLWVEGRCTAYGATSPFLPIADAVRRLMRIDDRDDEAQATEKLERGVAAAGEDLAWTAPFLRQLLSLRQNDESVASLDSASRRSELFRALRALLLRAAESRPLVLVAEDLHWVDSASEEFLTFLSELIPASRILLVCSYRPGYRHPFGDSSYHVRLTLRPLSGGEIAEVAGSLLRAGVLPPEVSRLVSSKAEGNPFFVEEVTKSLLEDGSLRRHDGRVVLTRDLADVAVPDTIQEVLLARIDRLAVNARQAMQIASVIGREFALRLLDRIVETGGGVEPHLAELRALELIYEKALHPELAYMFKHALTHEVAYESVVAERRRDLHRTIGLAIEELYADRLPEHYEALAHHFARGCEWEKALDYHARAAVKASESYANQAVIDHCEVALSIAERLGDGAPRDAVIKIYQLLGTTAFYMSRFSLSARSFEGAAATANDAPAARGAFLGLAGLAHLWAHQYAACIRLIDTTKAHAREHDLLAGEAYAVSLEGQYRVILQEEFDSAERLCAEASELAVSSGDDVAIGLTSFPVMLMQEWKGEYDKAILTADRIVSAGNRTGMANLVVWPTWFIGKALCCLGKFGPAIAQMKEAYAVCDRIGDIAWKGRLLNTLGWAYAEIGSVEQAREHNEQALVLARDLEDVEITGNAGVNLSRNHLELGDLPRALAYIEPIEDELRRTGDPWMRWRYRLHAQDARAEIELHRGEPDRALAAASAEVEGAQRHRAPKIEARALLVCGRSLVKLERFDEARETLERALALAERIRHPRGAWQAHGAMASLALLRGDRAEHERAGSRKEALIGEGLASLDDPGLKARFRAAARVG